MAASATKSRTRPFDSLAQEAFLNIWRTYDRLKAHEDGLFARYDLSAQQYNALRLLQLSHPDTIPTLALSAKLVSRAPDITRLLDKLETRELIWRERRKENRRVVEVGVTPGGLKLLEELAEGVRECHSRQLGHLNDKQLRQLISLLQEVRGPHEEEESLWMPKMRKKGRSSN